MTDESIARRIETLERAAKTWRQRLAIAEAQLASEPDLERAKRIARECGAFEARIKMCEEMVRSIRSLQKSS